MGNPGAFSYSHVLWVKGFLDGLGSPHYYTAGSQDVNNRFAASALLYGSPLVVPIPDLTRTDFLLMVGANPLVSHGSVLSAPRVREQLLAVTERGGRVVVVDPRRTETARQFEHLPVHPDSDAWLLLSMLHVIFEEGLTDDAFLARADDRRGDGSRQQARRLLAPSAPRSATGVAGRAAARAGARVRDRAGSGRGLRAHRLLPGPLRHAGRLPARHAQRGHRQSRPARRSRLRRSADRARRDRREGRARHLRQDALALRRLSRTCSATCRRRCCPREITTPGERQIRALFVSAGNPVLSVPDGDALEAALGELDLMVSLDFYVNETNSHADYVLPATTFLEREDVPVALMGFFSHAVHPGHRARSCEPARRGAAGMGGRRRALSRASASRRTACRRCAGSRGSASGSRPGGLSTCCCGRAVRGDLFGLRRSGLSLAKLARSSARHRARRLHRHRRAGRQAPPRGQARAPARRRDRLRSSSGWRRSNGASPDFPLKLIGMRELRSHNSWMHNAALLMRGGRSQALRIHPGRRGVRRALGRRRPRRASRRRPARSRCPVTITDEMTPGTVALPHGWGHRGGWRLANEAGGVNVNLLAPSDPRVARAARRAWRT